MRVPDEAELAWLADLLDTRWRIPGTNWRFGIDALAGLAPGLGDLISGLAGLYIFAAARHAGAPRLLLLRMVGNLTLVGSIPLLGRIFDVAFKANKKNMRLLQAFLERSRAERAVVINP